MRAAVFLAALVLAIATTLAQETGGTADIDPDIWPEHAASDEDTAGAGRAAMPFTQEQIHLLGALLQQVREATADAGGEPPSARLRRLQIHPGEGRMPLIHLARGYTSAVTFSDITGEPWPIEEVLVDQAFLPGRAESRPPGAQHILYLAPARSHLHGNALVKLAQITEPVVLALADGEGHADVRVDIRITLPGPSADAEALVQRPTFQAGDGHLLELLAGQPPAGATRLVVTGGSPADRGWAAGEDILLLTTATLLSPGPWAAERSADGRWAYRLPETPFALVSRDGQPHRLDFRIEATAAVEETAP